MVHYRRPLYRLPEFLVAIIAGYRMYNMRNYDNKLSNFGTLKSWACWLLCLSFMYCHVYNILKPKFPKFYYDAIERSLWSLALCWIIYASHIHKTGGPIRWFLSLNMWQPFSKIGLSLYLIHFFYLRSTIYKIKEKSAYGCWWNVQIFVGDIIFSCLLGLVVYLLIEAPTGKILEIVWRKNKKSEDSEEMEKLI